MQRSRWQLKFSGFLLLLLIFIFVFLTFTPAAYAHAFGQLYNLPIPFWMYLYGGAAAIIVSFLIIGYFVNKSEINLEYPTKKILIDFFTRRWFVAVVKFISIFFFILTIATGFFGIDSPYSNFNMIFFWIIFAIGLTYLSAIVGNVYSLINPWRILVEFYERISGENLRGIISYPTKLGYFPALLIYFILIWFELIGQTGPFMLSTILLQYTLINFAAVYFFGKDVWFRYGEFFSVFFGLIAKMAPIEQKSGELHLRPPFAGLLKEKASDFSMLLFVLFMLSTTAFDGFRETVLWVRFYWGSLDDFIRPILGEISYASFETIGLLLSPFVFLGIYIALITAAKIAAKSKLSIRELSLQFAFSIVPVAFAYNVAHYYTLIITEGPKIINLVSDPFGFKWNLFGTANYFSGVIPDANFVWHSQVAIIVAGHIVGVYLAHIIALNTFPSHKHALLSQVPMLILMVSYTMIGLWILSQPITSGI